MNRSYDEIRYRSDEQVRYLRQRYPNLSIIHGLEDVHFTIDGSSWLNMVMAACYSMVTIVGLVSNIWVLYHVLMVIRHGNNKTPSILVYMVALSCLNLLVMTVCMPVTITDLILGQWPFPTFLCKFHWMIEIFNKTLASLLISLITVSCYCAICQEDMEKMYKSKTVAAITVAAGLSIIIFVFSPILKHAGVYHLMGRINRTTFVIYETKCLFQPTEQISDLLHFTVCSFVCGYAIPLATMTFCYGSILFKLRFRSKFQQQSIRLFRRVLKSVLFLVCFYLASRTPYWIVTLVLSFNDETIHNEYPYLFVTVFVVHLLPFINCACSTLLYKIQLRFPKRKRRFMGSIRAS